jgi:hypothetical protein
VAKFTFENAFYAEAKRALEENLTLLDPERHKTAHNLTVALAYIVRQIGQIQKDVDLLHNKIQPILQELAEDSNWRDRHPKYED